MWGHDVQDWKVVLITSKPWTYLEARFGQSRHLNWIVTVYNADPRLICGDMGHCVSRTPWSSAGESINKTIAWESNCRSRFMERKSDRGRCAGLGIGHSGANDSIRKALRTTAFSRYAGNHQRHLPCHRRWYGRWRTLPNDSPLWKTVYYPELDE